MSNNWVEKSERVTVKAVFENQCSINPRIKDRSCPFGFKKLEPRCQFCTRYNQETCEDCQQRIEATVIFSHEMWGQAIVIKYCL